MRKAYCEDHVVSGTDFPGSAGVSPAAFTTFALTTSHSRGLGIPDESKPAFRHAHLTKHRFQSRSNR
jgi:hypothetical protein